MFHLIDNGDGEAGGRRQGDVAPKVTLEEFIDGIMRCKGPARAIDQARDAANKGKTTKRPSKQHVGTWFDPALVNVSFFL